MLHQVLLLENECVSHLIVIFFFSKNSPHQKSATQVFQIETFILNLQNIRVIEAHSGKTGLFHSVHWSVKYSKIYSA